MIFLILLGVLVLGMVCYAFWPRPPQHMVDLDDLEHPKKPDAEDPH